MIKIVQTFDEEPNYQFMTNFGYEYSFPQKGRIVYNLKDLDAYACVYALLEAMRIEGYSDQFIESLKDYIDEYIDQKNSLNGEDDDIEEEDFYEEE